MKSTLVRVSCAAGLVVAAFYAFLTLRGPNGIPGVVEKRRLVRSLQEQNANVARENQLKKEGIRRLAENPTDQEMEIRKRLKLARPGETVFILPGEPGKAPAPEAR